MNKKQLQDVDPQSQRHVSISNVDKQSKKSYYEKQSTRLTISSNQEKLKLKAQQDFKLDLQRLKKKLKQNISSNRNIIMDRSITSIQRNSAQYFTHQNQFEYLPKTQNKRHQILNKQSIRRKSCTCQKCGAMTKFEFKTTHIPQFLKMKDKLFKIKKKALHDIYDTQMNKSRPHKLSIDKKKTQYFKKNSQEIVESPSPQTFKHSDEQPNSPVGQISPINSSNYIIEEEFYGYDEEDSQQKIKVLNDKFQKYAYAARNYQHQNEENPLLITTRNKRSQTLTNRSRTFTLSLTSTEKKNTDKNCIVEQIKLEKQPQPIVEKIEELKFEDQKEVKPKKLKQQQHLPKIHELFSNNLIPNKSSQQ